jgi:hypothetical protein
MLFRFRIIACSVACVAGAAGAARAQDGDPAETARFQLGSLRFTPSILVSNIGVDSNVYNETENPKSDKTAAVGPAADLWLDMGRTRLSGRLSGQYLYYAEYENQRSWNSAHNLRYDVALSRLTPYVAGSYADTRERPGYEIDARARRLDTSGTAGTGVRLSGKTELVLSYRRGLLDYADDQFFDGVELSQVLNRQTNTANANLRVRLTPLTTFVVRTEMVQERFDTETIRDANSFAVVPGFELRPQALISGEAFVGVRRFATLSDQAPDYTGIVAAVKTAYTVRATKFGVRVGRDISYSYEVEQPYYTLTDLGLEVTERVTSVWDIVGRTAWQRLAYKTVTTSPNQTPRTDHGWQVGGGAGYRFGQTLRLGVDANYYQRESIEVDTRNYEGLRMGLSISYGLPQ